MRIVRREDWGAARPNCITRIPKVNLMGSVIHYSGMNADEQAHHRNCAERVRGIQHAHMSGANSDRVPWCDIAYNWVVCKHGYIFIGRGWLVRSAAQGTNFGNAHYHAIMFLGDDTPSRDDVTMAGRNALLQRVLRNIEKAPHARELHGHREFHSTACPGNQLQKWITLVRPVLA